MCQVTALKISNISKPGIRPQRKRRRKKNLPPPKTKKQTNKQTNKQNTYSIINEIIDDEWIDKYCKWYIILFKLYLLYQIHDLFWKCELVCVDIFVHNFKGEKTRIPVSQDCPY
jgi:hypothetical protein